MKPPRLFALLVLLIPSRLLAVQTDAPDCSAPTTQTDMNRCAFEDFLAANGAQAAVLKGLDRGLAAPDRQRLRTAQKTWLAAPGTAPSPACATFATRLGNGWRSPFRPICAS